MLAIPRAASMKLKWRTKTKDMEENKLKLPFPPPIIIGRFVGSHERILVAQERKMRRSIYRCGYVASILQKKIAISYLCLDIINSKVIFFLTIIYLIFYHTAIITNILRIPVQTHPHRIGGYKSFTINVIDRDEQHHHHIAKVRTFQQSKHDAIV